MKRFHGPLVLVLGACTLVACQSGGAVNPGSDGGDSWHPSPDGADSSTPDGADSFIPDGSAPVPVLRNTINIDLSQVASFVVVSGTSSKGPRDPDDPSRASPVAKDGDTPQLLALTLDGEVLDVSFVTSSTGTGVYAEPVVSRIYPTPAWILFMTSGFTVFKLHDDGTSDTINCVTIAARRSDGALYCTDLAIGDDGGNDPRFKSVAADAAGELIYVISGDALGRSILYKLAMDGADGPVGTLVDATIHPNWFFANASGDLLVNWTPSGMDPTTAVTRVLPVDGSAPFTVDGTSISFAATGEAGAADQDTFYVLDGANAGSDFAGTIHVVARGDSSFIDTPGPITVAGANNCMLLHRLSDGLYVFCNFQPAKVVADGAVIPAPVPIPLTNYDRFLDVHGMPIRFGSQLMILVAGYGTEHEFIRHDGVTQQDIPLDTNIELLSLTVSPEGDMDFIGDYLDTGAKVIGTVPIDATEVTIVDTTDINPEQVTVFTRIN